jgi:hypothetical protein
MRTLRHHLDITVTQRTPAAHTSFWCERTWEASCSRVASLAALRASAALARSRAARAAPSDSSRARRAASASPAALRARSACVLAWRSCASRSPCACESAVRAPRASASASRRAAVDSHIEAVEAGNPDATLIIPHLGVAPRRVGGGDLVSRVLLGSGRRELRVDPALLELGEQIAHLGEAQETQGKRINKNHEMTHQQTQQHITRAARTERSDTTR